MGAREDIIDSFKYELRKTPFDKLKVSTICDGAAVSRNCFYSHFRDKESIVEQLFDDHVVASVRSLNSNFGVDDLYRMAPILHERIYQGIYAEREYYYSLIHGIFGRNDVFLKVATRSLFELNQELFSRFQDSPTPWYNEYSAYFFASSQAMLIQKWVNDHFAVSPRSLSMLYQDLTSAYWENMYSKQK